MRLARPPRRRIPRIGLMLAVVAVGAAFLIGPPDSWARQGMPLPPGDLKCTEIYLGATTNTVKMEWPPTFQETGPTYDVWRSINGGVVTLLGQTQDRFWVDSTLTSPFVDANLRYTVNVFDSCPLRTASITVDPKKSDAAENQAVDSRLDLRFSTNTLLDYSFGGRTFRGGLWAGFAADPSRVGRSFVKFSLPTLSGNVWVGMVNAYHTRSFAPGATTVGCQWLRVGKNSWSAATLKWSNAPAIDPAAATQTRTVTDTAGSGSGWNYWNMQDGLCEAFATDRILSVALASTNEAQSGWAYFAKKEYATAGMKIQPAVVYALGAPARPGLVTVSPTSVPGGTNSTGTVWLNGNAPTGGTVVNLSSSMPAAASVPATVTVPQGASTANFTITTYSVMQSTQVTISATVATDTKTAVLTVTP